MRLKVDLVASVAKDAQRQDLNEDAYALGETCFALADGASESYDSKNWAQLLTKAYLLDQGVNVSWVTDRVRSYVEASDFTSLSWSRQAAFERGSFATLLGLKWSLDSENVELLAIGDSLAVHVRNGVMLTSFPFQHAEQFDARPLLLSTQLMANDFVRKSDFCTTSTITWPVQAGDQIFLVTDAVGHWLLSHDEALTVLSTIRNPEEFEKMVFEKRSDKTMRLDDSTVLRIVINSSEPEYTA